MCPSKLSDLNVSFFDGDHGHYWVDSCDQEFFEEGQVFELVWDGAWDHLVLCGERIEITKFTIS